MPHDPAPRTDWKARVRQAQHRVRETVPAGARLPLGLVLIGFGIVGFLPIVGFWMIPLGIAVAAMDIKPIWLWLRGRKNRTRSEDRNRDRDRDD